MSARILVVDDTPGNIKILTDVLNSAGYHVDSANNGTDGIARITSDPPDLVMLDVVMPGLSGYDVCRQLRAHPSTALLPVIMVTSLDPRRERVAGIEAGADDFLSRPFNPPELLARVRSLLRIKALQDRTTRQAEELVEWNAKLESRVSEQVAQLQRLDRLKGFFAPQIAELIVSGGPNELLEPHRREVAVLFLDLRGFTAFTAKAPPDVVMRVLAEYHAMAGERIVARQGAIERFAGDGMMAFFNDPVPVDNAAAQAVAAALEIGEGFAALRGRWAGEGHALDLGMGLALGEATLGAIGFEGRQDYAAIGPVTNLAARLCERAKGGQLLVDGRTLERIRDVVKCSPSGEAQLKGFLDPVPVHVIEALTQPQPARPLAASASAAPRAVAAPVAHARAPANLGDGAPLGTPPVMSWSILERLAQLGVVRTYPRNMVVLTEGDVSDSIYVILEGRVKIYVSDEEGDTVVLGEQGVGEYFGEISLDEGPRSASVATIEACRLAVIPRLRFRAFAEQHPELAMILVERLIRRVRQLTANVKGLALMDVYARFVHLLYELAKEHDGIYTVEPRPTQQDMAERIGSSREMISRLLRDLSAGGYIRVESERLVILRRPPKAW